MLAGHVKWYLSKGILDLSLKHARVNVMAPAAPSSSKHAQVLYTCPVSNMRPVNASHSPCKHSFTGSRQNLLPSLHAFAAPAIYPSRQ